MEYPIITQSRATNRIMFLIEQLYDAQRINRVKCHSFGRLVTMQTSLNWAEPMPSLFELQFKVLKSNQVHVNIQLSFSEEIAMVGSSIAGIR